MCLSMAEVYNCGAVTLDFVSAEIGNVVQVGDAARAGGGYAVEKGVAENEKGGKAESGSLFATPLAEALLALLLRCIEGFRAGGG